MLALVGHELAAFVMSVPLDKSCQFFLGAGSLYYICVGNKGDNVFS